MMNSSRNQLQDPLNLLNIIWDHIAINNIIRNCSFFMICKPCKLKVSNVETNPQQ